MYKFISPSLFNFNTYKYKSEKSKIDKIKDNELTITSEIKSEITSDNIDTDTNKINSKQPWYILPSIPKIPPEKKEIVADMTASVIQAFLYTATGYPFDLVKARLQSGLYDSSWSCLTGTIKTEGFTGLYRGAVMPWLSHTLKRPIQYPASEYLKKYTTTDSKSKNTCLNYLIGGATGMISPILGTPLQVVKISMQTSTSITLNNNISISPITADIISGPKNSLYFIKHNYQTNGIAGFYRGFVPTFVKDTVFGASFLGTYYTLRDINGHDTYYKNFFNGAAAHCTTWFVFMPIDYVKTTIQKSDKPLKIKDVVTTTYEQHGVKTFWKGVIPACLRTIPMSGIAMLGYEWVRNTILNDE